MIRLFLHVLFFSCLVQLQVGSLVAQSTKLPKKTTSSLLIPMEAAYWQFDSTKVEFITHRSVKAVRGKNQAVYQLFLKDQVFTNGTIEFDVELLGAGFPGINFRMSSDGKNGENVYLRSFGPVPPEVRTTLQYAPLVDGVSLWDLYDEYQSGALLYQQGWNHLKLVVQGRQMAVYVNDMSQPCLQIPHLDATTDQGGLSLSGNVIYANLRIQSTPVGEPLAAWAYNPVAAGTRYLRQWQVSGPTDLPFGQEPVFTLPSTYGTLTKSDIPDSTAQWKPLFADTRGMVNLSTRYGGVINDGRRVAWLKTTLYSDQAQSKQLQLGFSYGVPQKLDSKDNLKQLTLHLQNVQQWQLPSGASTTLTSRPKWSWKPSKEPKPWLN